MEALTLLVDSIAMILLVYMGLRDDRRKLGTPQTSLFRTHEDGNVSPREALERLRQERIARSRAL